MMTPTFNPKIEANVLYGKPTPLAFPCELELIEIDPDQDFTVVCSL